VKGGEWVGVRIMKGKEKGREGGVN